MDHPSSELNSFSKENINSKILNFLVKTKFILDLNDEEFANIFELPQNSITSILSNKNTIRIDHFAYILERLNLSFEAVINDTIDYEVLLKQFHHNPYSIPKKYTKCAQSKKRTLKNIFNYILRYRGGFYLRSILKYFQVHVEAFHDDDGLINHNFMTDLLTLLSEKNFDPKDIYAMGANSFQCNEGGFISQMFQNFNSQQDVLECLAHEKSYFFDKNYEYKITKMNKNECFMQISQFEEVAEKLGKVLLGSELVNTLKAGVISTIPQYAGFQPAHVTTLKSVHQGSPYTLYHIQFSQEKFLH
ncbi:MAG: hypothetical protein H6621_08800 [Halobacteriovoraceae bacterium]|nr:hypothetical protein [Halobacteriovoraceae bacterium]MCB9095152.1 hypothetical protein [Halobacteriovoraceae bacterium]